MERCRIILGLDEKYTPYVERIFKMFNKYDNLSMIFKESSLPCEIFPHIAYFLSHLSLLIHLAIILCLLRRIISIYITYFTLHVCFSSTPWGR